MDKSSFISTKKLYHYTSFESAIKIIATNTLRFGKLEAMNDINEAYRSIFYGEGLSITEKDVKNALQEYQQLSFTMDKKSTPGYSISAMWGHYAKKGCGVCLVFDSNAIKRLVDTDKSSWCGKIKYSKNYDGSMAVTDNDIHKFLNDKHQEIFFIKTQDWAYEQEWRVVKRVGCTDNHTLNIGDSLIGIILYASESTKSDDSIFNSPEAENLTKLAPQTPIFGFGQWNGEPILKNANGEDWAKRDDSNWKLDV